MNQPTVPATPRIEIGAGEAGIFGYGSLLSIASLEHTLGRTYERPLVVCILDGWRRRWNVAMPNRAFFWESEHGREYPERICYLNIERSPGVMLNGVLFIVRDAELEAFDRREWIYDRIDVRDDLRDADVVGGRVFTYVAKPDYVIDANSRRQAAIRSSYLRILEDGLGTLGLDFRLGFERSSQSPPRRLIIEDQTDPLAPNAPSVNP